MPSWPMHLLIAKGISKKIKLKANKANQFMIGNLLPDIYSGYIIEDASKVLEYEVSHYGTVTKVNGYDYTLPDYEKFINENEIKENYVAIGYLTHILTDYFFNQYAFELKYIKNDKDEVVAIRNKVHEIVKSNSDMARVTKQNDFKIYSNYILLNNKFKCFDINDDVLNEAKRIKQIEIENEDLLKMKKYVDNMLKDKQIEKLDEDALEMFSKHEIDNMINMCEEFILLILRKNELI